jgi:hypothetical protein
MLLWEYNYVSSTAATSLEKFTGALNELGLEGWEVVGYSLGGPGVGKMGAILKRARRQLDAPAHATAEAWLADPSGRHPDRWWDGETWTKWVRDQEGGTRREDPPYGPIVSGAS